MPIFDMECKVCHSVILDHLLNMKATVEDYPKCEACGGDMEKQIAVPARAQFKGRGFHRVEYNAPTRG